MEINITTQLENDFAIIFVNGELDDYNAPTLNDLLSEIINIQKYYKIIINLEGTMYLDSIGLGTIAIAASKVAKNNGVLNIVCTKPQIIKLLNASGMVSMIKRNIKIYDDLDQAKKALSNN